MFFTPSTFITKEKPQIDKFIDENAYLRSVNKEHPQKDRMIEQHIILEGIDPVSFYGANNVHLTMLKKLYPKLRIVARDNVIKVIGDEEELERFRQVVDRLIAHCTRYNSIDEESNWFA